MQVWDQLNFASPRPLIACTLVGITLGDRKPAYIGTLETIALGYEA